MKLPFTEVEVSTANSGFYEGYNIPIALISKLIIAGLVIWALVWPGNANTQLGTFNGNLLDTFNSFYVIAVGCFSFFLFALPSGLRPVVVCWAVRAKAQSSAHSLGLR